MNVLFFSRSAINDASSFGNTVMNLFSGWSGVGFYHFYIRKQAPQNSIIREYFNLSSADTVKALLKGHSAGRRFTSSDAGAVRESWTREETAEKTIIESTRRGKKSWLYYLEESFWATKLWQNRRFKAFIKDADPDIFFAFATNSYVLYPLINYLKKHTRAKIVLFIVDDMLSTYGKRGWIRRANLTRKLRWCIRSADKLYGISDKMCEHYSEVFGKPVEFLCKGCDCSLPSRESEGYPLKLVYAGNVLYGRESTLAGVVEALKAINAGRKTAELDIYTNTNLQPEVLKKLNVPGISRVLEGIPYEQLLRVENRADVLLHVESFDPDISEKVRYSFSTKITDCLQSGTAVAAIGPGGIASIDYLKKTPGATVITEPAEMTRILGEMLSDIEALNGKKREIRAYAQAHLSKAEMKNKLREDFEELISH